MSLCNKHTCIYNHDFFGILFNLKKKIKREQSIITSLFTQIKSQSSMGAEQHWVCMGVPA